MKCKHCKYRAANAPRGLCKVCYADKPIRHLYPVMEYALRKRADHEPTAEELELLIAERMRNLPAWWNRPAGAVDSHPN